MIQIRDLRVRLRGRDEDEQDGAAWGDEREVAVWGQVSARMLYLVIALNVIAAFVFNSIDSRRYEPCVMVFFAIAFGSTVYAGWVAHRKGVDVRAPRETNRAGLVVQCLVAGVIFYLINRFALGDHSHDSWDDALLDIVGYGIGWGIAMRFFAAWRRRQELMSQEADEAPDAPDPTR